MDFSLSEEQILLRDSLHGSLGDLVSLDLLQSLNKKPDSDVSDLRLALQSIGLPGMLINEDHGGSSLGLLDAAVAAEQLGYAAAPYPFIANDAMAPLAFQLCADSAIQQTWLPALARGERRVAMAVSDWANGVRKDTGLKSVAGKLSGMVRLALDCDDSNDCDAILLADRDGQLYLVAADANGLQIEPNRTIDITRRVANLRLSGVNATPLAGVYADSLTRVVDAGRVLFAADTLGASQAMLEQAVAYAMQREQFGRRIASFQAVKHMCAEMAAQLAPCRALVWYAAYAFDHLPEEFALHSALAKSHLDETGRFVARTATEVHGGMGFTDLQGLHYWFKRIGFNRAALGDAQSLRARAAGLQGLGRPPT